MRKVKYYHVGNAREFDRFEPREAKAAIETLRDISGNPGSRLSVVYSDGLVMTLRIDGFEDPKPEATA